MGIVLPEKCYCKTLEINKDLKEQTHALYLHPTEQGTHRQWYQQKGSKILVVSILAVSILVVSFHVDEKWTRTANTIDYRFRDVQLKTMELIGRKRFNDTEINRKEQNRITNRGVFGQTNNEERIDCMWFETFRISIEWRNVWYALFLTTNILKQIENMALESVLTMVEIKNIKESCYPVMGFRARKRKSFSVGARV